MDVYENAARVFKPDIDLPPATQRLRGIFAGIVTAFETLRRDRLRAAPLDESRMQIIRQHMSEAALGSGPSIACFQGYSVNRRRETTAIPTEFEFGTMDKGAFTSPVMSEVDFNDLPPLFAQTLQVALSNAVWQELGERPQRDVPVDLSAGTESFWRTVVAEAATVGPTPIVIVPYGGYGDEITAAVLQRPGAPLREFAVSHVANVPSGGGTGYLGTINEVHVYSARITNLALLCSSRIIRAIDYDVVHGEADVVDFSFIEGDDLAKSRVHLRFSQNIEWADTPIVKFNLTPRGPSSD
jgi:hypothetical protein